MSETVIKKITKPGRKASHKQHSPVSKALYETTGLAESRFNEVLEALDEGIILWDSDFCFVMANKRMLEILYSEIEPPEPGDRLRDVVQKQIESGMYNVPQDLSTGQFVENRLELIKTYQKGQDYVLADGRLLVGSSHKTSLGGCLVTFREVTDERRNEEMINDVFQSLSEGLSLYDAELKFVIRNNRRFEMLSAQDFKIEKGTHLSEVTYQLASSGRIQLSDKETPQQWSDRIVELTRQCAEDIEIPGTDGRLYLLSVHKTRLGGYLLVFKDITEQHRAEVAEQDAELLLRTIVEACPTTFLVSRVEDGKIIYFPPASRERFGDIDSTLEFFLNPDDRKKYLEELMPSGILNDYPVQFLRRDDTIMQGLTSARITDYKGEDVIVSATRDITDQLAMQAELERQRNHAHQNEKLSALGELLAGVAHELNNPLSIIVGYSLMLRNKIEDPTQKKRIERIGEAAERCAKIVKMFLAMARQRPARIENCSLNEILETALDVAGYGLKAAGVRVKLELAPDLPPVAADPDQIAQVFINLIANAEHSLVDLGEGGRLKLISLYDKESNEVVVKIRDNGAGVPREIQPRVFEPFFTTKDIGTGTGIGLAFSHRIITSHEGTLRLYSVPGNGATFIVRMQAAVSSFVPVIDEAEKPAIVKNKRVLVVDDEVGVSDLIRDVLEESRYEVETFNDARQALLHLKLQNYDAILSDMKMPGLNGEAFFKEVQFLDGHQAERFAFITGDIMSTSVVEFFEGTSALYLEKPVSPTDLIGLVEQLCTQGRDGGK